MGEYDVLTPEDDLFGRVALFNKLITLNQIVECSRVISAEMIAGRPRHSLASVLIAKGHISAKAAGAVEKAVQERAVEHAGEASPAEGLPPEPKPMKKRAPAGDSQVMVAVRPPKGKAQKQEIDDERFRVNVPKKAKSAILDIACHNLYPNDSPAFEAACRHLLETDRAKLYIDLSKVRHVPSVIIGQLGKAAVTAKAEERLLTVLGNRDTAKVIQMVHGNSIEVRVS